MLIYILLIILSTIIFISHIYVKDEKVNFVTAFVWVLLMTLFVGSQDGIGTDHSNYIAQIESPWVVPSEPFTILVFAIIRSFGISSYAFFYIYAFLTYFYLAKAVLLSDRNIRFIVVIMILQSLLFFQSFNLVRQILACAIFLYGLMLISCGKKHYIVFVLAFLVHYSALFGILMIVLAKMIKVNIVVLMIYIGSVCILLWGGFMSGFISIFEPIIGKTYYGYYLESALINENQTAHFGVVYQVIFVLSLIVYAKRNYYVSNNLELILNVFFLGQIMYNVLSANITLQRITYYPYVSMVFVIPLLAKSLHSYWTTRNALLLYLIYFVFILASLSSKGSPYVPYKSICLILENFRLCLIQRTLEELPDFEVMTWQLCRMLRSALNCFQVTRFCVQK